MILAALLLLREKKFGVGTSRNKIVSQNKKKREDTMRMAGRIGAAVAQRISAGRREEEKVTASPRQDFPPSHSMLFPKPIFFL